LKHFPWREGALKISSWLRRIGLSIGVWASGWGVEGFSVGFGAGFTAVGRFADFSDFSDFSDLSDFCFLLFLELFFLYFLR